jgi:hypothetical protein
VSDYGRVAISLCAVGVVMAPELCKEVAECHRHASEARIRAKLAQDPGLRQDFLDMERRWMVLARSYELSERQASFIDIRPGGNKYSR